MFYILFILVSIIIAIIFGKVVYYGSKDKDKDKDKDD